MLNMHKHAEQGVPLWAIAAPIVGVPIMVGLLAITAPRETPIDGATPVELAQPQELAASVAHHCVAQGNES